jgi:hypothetical protein
VQRLPQGGSLEVKNNIADLKEKYFLCIVLFAASLYLKRNSMARKKSW